MVYINDCVDKLDVGRALAEGSEQRREQALRFRFEQGRRLSLAAYLLLKEGLEIEYGFSEHPVFRYSVEGKPFIENPSGAHFSLSHSKSVALCVLSRQPVGADVEAVRPVGDDLVRYTMNDRECDWIFAAPDKVKAFLTLWTRKEAVLKLTGEGIRNDLKSVLRDANTYCIETALAENYVYSVARFRNSSEIIEQFCK